MRSGELFVFLWCSLPCLSCFAKVGLRSIVRPVFTLLFVESVLLFIVSLSLVESSAGDRVNSIVCVLRGLKFIVLFELVEYVLQV